MATYVNDLRLKEITTGDESGTWGTSTNTNLELIAEAFSYGTEVITTNADTHATVIADGSTDPGRSLYLKYTGTLDSDCTITIGPNTVSKVWIIENGTSGSQNINISQGSGANITIPAGDTKVVYSDGAGAGAAFFDAFASLSVVDLKVQDDLTVTGDIDVDGTTNLDVVDIDGAVDMASTALVTGVLTTTAATVFNGGFASNAASTISTADNLDTLSLISTDADANSGPNLRLYRNSSSPANNDFLGFLEFEGRNNNSQDVIYGSLAGFIDDVADGTEDGIIRLSSIVAGTLRNRMDIIPTGTVFNEDSIDLDFRVESDNNANALFVQGSDGYVGIGTSSPSANLEITQSGNNVGLLVAGGGYNYTAKFESSDAEANIIIEDSNSTNDGNMIGVATNDMYFITNTAERLRIDSSGNVGIGTSSPGTSNTAGISLIPGTTSYVSATGSNGSAQLLLGNNNGGSNSATDTSCGSIAFKARFNGTFGGGNDVASIVGTYTGDGTTRSGVIRFLTINVGAEAERMRINSSGTLLVGTTSAADTDPGAKIFSSGIMVQGVPDTGLVDMHDFYRGTSGSLTRVGNIRTNGSSTSYNTSSDYRLKEDDVPMTGATERVKALRPINFAWKVDGSRVDGFLAHEVQEIVPEAISGTKDAMTAEVLYVEGDELPEGKSIGDVKTASVPDYQGIDQSKLVPLLTKALQEALTKIEQLETRLETLENA
jgi:hypothetical protein